MSSPVRRKLLVVGDSGCGKTQLFMSFTKTFRNYIPTVFESYVADMEVDGTCIELGLWDTSGQDLHERLRPLAYTETHVILACFSVDLPSSLDSIQHKYSPELNHYCPGVSTILVCCKKDLRHDPDVIQKLARKGQRPLTSEAGMVVARMIGVGQYMECSAKSREGVDELFQCAARASLRTPARSRGRRSCVVL